MSLNRGARKGKVSKGTLKRKKWFSEKTEADLHIGKSYVSGTGGQQCKSEVSTKNVTIVGNDQSRRGSPRQIIR